MRIAAMTVSAITGAISLVLRAVILTYRYGLSPVLGAHCRYTPSCSSYADQAIRVHGPLYGSWLALKRILRCNPWGGMGYDPIPEPGPQPLKHSVAKSAATASPIDSPLPDPIARS